MTPELHVLIIEDSETDALLLLRHITKGGFLPVYERVDSADEMRIALAKKQWDVVLSDHNMPGFNSLGALQILKESHQDIPFIIISGIIGEEMAVEALKAGAHDYLLKDKLTRLLPAIKRELNEAKQRQQLRETEAQRQYLEDQLNRAKDLAEAANKRKSRVLAFVAHEFKNPMNAISTFSDILMKSDLPDKQREYVEHIRTACQHVRDLMNDILDIAPIEAGTIKLDIQEVDITSLVEEVKIIVEEPAKQKQISLQFNISHNVETLSVDPKRLRQILINLMSNAIKYTNAQDTVILNVYPDLCNEKPCLSFEVIDHGIGIPESELENLFQDYYRVRNTLTAQREGLGLGLALCQKLVQLHGGSIDVKSAENAGSTFIVKIPLEQQASLVQNSLL